MICTKKPKHEKPLSGWKTEKFQSELAFELNFKNSSNIHT